MFGRAAPTGMVAACVNPAKPEGGAAELKSYFSTRGVSIVDFPLAPTDWVTPAAAIETPFVRLPGLIHAECETDSTGSYLAISVTPQPDDRRTRTIPGDVIRNGKVVPQWGLHLIDANLVAGNLVDLIAGQSALYAKTAAGQAGRP
jgi:hypothetical protein